MSKDIALLCIIIKITIFIEFSNPLQVQMSMKNEITIYDKYSYELKKKSHNPLLLRCKQSNISFSTDQVYYL